MKGLEGHEGLPAQQPLPYFCRSCAGGEGHGCTVYQCTWCIGHCGNGTFCLSHDLLLISGL